VTGDGPAAVTKAVFFDVDFTLIHPGPMFQGAGYRAFCANHGLAVDASAFDAAVRSASFILDEADEALYAPQMFIDYTKHIIERMGGSGPGVDASARDIYEAWTGCQHFMLYDDVPDALQELAARKIRVGLISNSHRSLEAFQRHFELDGLIHGAISSSEHGYMKPHASIFEAALRLLDVPPADALMVGDSFRQDIDGARRVGMRGVLVRRADARYELPVGEGHRLDHVVVIRSLAELPPLL
jgi:putative hydrolase of the HAD superfamily